MMADNKTVPNDGVRIVLVRHGETFSNAGESTLSKIPATTSSTSDDKPANMTNQLNPRGQEQADKLAERLKRDFSFDGIFCSSFQRARDTLRPLLDRLGDVSVVYTDDLVERKLPNYWELGDVYADHYTALYKETFRSEYDAWVAAGEVAGEKREVSDFSFRDGETDRQVKERIQRAYGQILAQHAGGTVLVVCHGTLIQDTLRHFFPGIETVQDIGQNNTAVNIFDLTVNPQGRQVLLLGSTDHLPSELHLKFGKVPGYYLIDPLAD